MNRRSFGVKEKIFDVVVIVIVGIIALVTLFPLLNVLACSFSSADRVVAGDVGIFPVDFDITGYKLIFEDERIWKGFGNSLLYTLLGTIIQVTCQMLCAYPLSRKDFKGRKVINLMLVLTMFISGGMIPTYLILSELQITDTLLAIILPGCISVFNIIVIRTYMETSIPTEVQEAAMIDGCGDFKIFLKIVLPLCRPVIAIMLLYAIVGYWNSYYNAMIYVTNQDLYPLQNILNNILISNESSLGGGTDTNLAEQLKYVTIVVSSIPLLVIYPFFQKYFEKGVTLGGVKG